MTQYAIQYRNAALVILCLLALIVALGGCANYPIANSASPDGFYHSNSLFGDLVMDAYGNFKQQFPNGRYFFGNVDLYSFSHPWWIADSMGGIHTGNGYTSLGEAMVGIYH
jgi:hypothetical protein